MRKLTVEHVRLPAAVTSARAGRAFVAAYCARHAVPRATVDDAVLIASELLGNVYRHVRGAADLSVDYRAGTLRVEVGDGSHAMPVRARTGPDDVGGRGVLIMEALATSWGAERTAHGKTVWFELRT